MRNQNTFGDKLSNWRVVSTNVQPRLVDMPHLVQIHTELVGVVGEAEKHDAEQETVRARFRELTAKRRDIERRGQTLRARLAAHLKGTFGFTSEQLIQFGVSPLKSAGRRRKAKPAENPATPGTPGTP